MRSRPFICASPESAATTVTTENQTQNIQLPKVKQRPIAPLRSLPQSIISKLERAFCRARLRNKAYTICANGILTDA